MHIFFFLLLHSCYNDFILLADLCIHGIFCSTLSVLEASDLYYYYYYYYRPRSLLHSCLADPHNNTVSLTKHPHSVLYQTRTNYRACSNYNFCLLCNTLYRSWRTVSCVKPSCSLFATIAVVDIANAITQTASSCHILQALLSSLYTSVASR